VSLEDALRRYPLTETNAAALDLERRAAALGIDLVPWTVKDRPRPGAGRIAAFDKVVEVMPGWLKSELERPSPTTISEPPKVLVDFLSSRTRLLAAVRAGILEGEPPVWAERLDQGHRSPRPFLAKLLYLQELLIVDALMREGAGDDATALEDLEATWRLREALASSPFVDSRFLAMASARFEAGALRRIDRVPRKWRERLAALTPVPSMLEVLRLGTVLEPIDLAAETFGITGPFAQTRRAVTRAYWRKCIDDAAGPYFAQLDRLEASAPSCDSPLEERIRSGDLSWWNRPGMAVRSASRLALDIEMTLKILDLRAAREENHGRWPESLAGLEKSETCPKDRWIYEIDAQGGMRLSLSRALQWDIPLGTILPTTYEEGPAPENAGRPKPKTLPRPGPRAGISSRRAS
jgi:hypothetical protein